MTKRIVFILLVFVIIGSLEILFHCYIAAYKESTASSLWAFYQHQDPYNGKSYIRGYIDLFIPAVILGIALGALGGWHTFLQWVLSIFGFSIAIVLLTLFYPGAYGAGDGLGVALFLKRILIAFATCGGFARGAFIVREHYRQTPPPI